jgi:hypothetical protein
LGSEKCAKYLISQGADVDKPGFAGLTPLMATWFYKFANKLSRKIRNRDAIVFALLEADANINTRNNEGSGRTALFYALDGKHAEDFLLGDSLHFFLRKKYKIDVNYSSTDTGLTPLMLLSAKNYLTEYHHTKSKLIYTHKYYPKFKNHILIYIGILLIILNRLRKGLLKNIYFILKALYDFKSENRKLKASKLSSVGSI